MRDSIDAQQKRQQETTKAATEWEKMECVANGKQTQGVVEREEKTVLERRSDRQKADNLSKFNSRQRRKCEFFWDFGGFFKRRLLNESSISRHSIRRCRLPYLISFLLVFFFCLLPGVVEKVADDEKRDQCWLQEKVRQHIERKQQEQQQQQHHIERRLHMADRLWNSQPNVSEKENRCYRRAVQQHEHHWLEQEQKRHQHIERLKSDRIESRLIDVENARKLREQCAADHERDQFNCRVNEKIDFAFDRQQRGKRNERIQKHRAIICRQIVSGEKRRTDEVVKDRVETNRAIVSEAEKNDSNFFEYASRLLNDAQCKGYPLNPLQKVIVEYKKQNSLLPRIDDLPHMKSHIDIGIAAERKAKVMRSTQRV